MSGFLDEALRAHADGDLCAQAAAGLLAARSARLMAEAVLDACGYRGMP